MPRTKGSKNRPKTTHTDYASQIAEKQESITFLTAEISSIIANIDTLKADLKKEEGCSEEGRKRSGNAGSEEGKGRCEGR